MTNSWDKFNLLLWKNMKLACNNKLDLALEFIYPLVFIVLLILTRFAVLPVSYPEKQFEKHEIKMQISVPNKISIYEIAYYPKTEFLNDIANRANKWILENSESDMNITIVGYDKEEDLEKRVMISKIIAAVRFSDEFINAEECPEKISYQIRYPSETRIQILPQTQTWSTNYRYNLHDFADIRYEVFPYDSFPFYYQEGFIGIQHAFSMAFIEKLKMREIPKSLFIQRLPYRPYVTDLLLHKIENQVPFILLIAFICNCSHIVKSIATEQEKQLKEIMEIMGIPNRLHWSAWFVRYLISNLILIIITVILLKVPWIKDAPFLPYSSGVLLFIFFTFYCIALTTFSFMVASFFKSANTAAASSAIFMIISFLPYIFSIPYPESLSAFTKYALSLFINSGLALGLELIIRTEVTKDGIQWDNLFEPKHSHNNISIGYIMIIFVLISIIHMLISLYTEKFFPGSYGASYKWYFLFTKEFWRRKKPSHLESDIDPLFHSNPNFEDEFDYKQVKMKIRNLRKEYGSKVAVNGLTLNLYENQITALLGHNGSGKTTTMAMLTGMIPPTSGTAILNGYDITTNLQEARMSLGFCPQYNILFDDLTVREHLIFYSRLKGLNEEEIEIEVEKFLNLLNLKRKRNTKTYKLPRGMKRRLSISAALCGGSKVVICDEPTSGMDPVARRALWDLLEIEKNGRTILISTHFMDEAEVLSDRVAIMSKGELTACGTPFFLKKKCGVGYFLICIKKEHCDPTKVDKLIMKYIPGLEIESDIGYELSYHIPERFAHKFKPMLQELEENSEELKISGFGISNPTLEHVFMIYGSVKEESYSMASQRNTNQLNNSKTKDNNLVNIEPKLSIGKKLREKQWKAMLLKKFILTKRNYKFAITKNLLAIFFFVIAVALYNFYPQYETLKAFNLNIAKYDSTVTVLESDEDSGKKLAEMYQRFIFDFNRTSTVVHIRHNLSTYFLEQEIPVLLYIKPAYLFAATIQNDSIIAWFNGQYYHALPTSINAMHNVLLRTTTGYPLYLIEVENYPFPFLEETLQERYEKRDFSYELSVCFPLGMSFVTALYIMLPIQERVSRAKLLQLVCGLKVEIYWITIFFIDILTLLLTMIICIITMYAIGPREIEMQSQLGSIFAVLIIFSIASLPFIYLASFWFSDPGTGFSRIVVLNMFTGCGLLYLCTVLQNDIEEDKMKFMESVLSISPTFFLARSLQIIMQISNKKRLCLKHCIEKEVGDCSEADQCKKNAHCCFDSLFTSYSGNHIVIGNDILIVLAAALFCLFCLLFVESGAFHLIQEKIDMFIYRKFRNPKKNFCVKQDREISLEKLKIQRMSKKDILSTNLVLNRVTKYYKKFIVVKKVSAQAKKFECFGLLGINGAGKTTLFKILTGEEKLSYGDAYVRGLSIKSDIAKIYRQTGYCPQAEALLEELTGRETMRIFALIRGIPEQQIRITCERLAKAFGFFQYIDEHIHKYSGGNKRKLSTSLAVIGNPSVIYLDEPTTGMDPAARRQIWNKICEIRDAGKTIVLTSHNMYECEALCTRLVIMINGEFKCIGSIQHLKNKFSEGFVVIIKVKRNINEEKPRQTTEERNSILEPIQQEDNSNKDNSNKDNSNKDNIAAVIRFVFSEFHGSSLKEHHAHLLTFSIPQESAAWYEIFGTMEKYKAVLNIEGYSVNQTTLDTVLFKIAKKNYFDTRIGN